MPISVEEFEKLPESSRSLVLDVIRDNPGLSQEQIRKEASKIFGREMSQGFAYRWCKILKEEGAIRIEKRGNMNAYYISETGAKPAKNKIWYHIEPNDKGELVVTSYTIGSITQSLKDLPLDRLRDFHNDHMKYEEYY